MTWSQHAIRPAVEAVQARETACPVCQPGAPTDSLAGALIGRLVYVMLYPILGAALILSFRRVRTLHRQRFPREGAVLLVANHPATWTDVLVLNVLLRRRLHFLALEELFRPWPRRALLQLFGALPLWRSDRVPDATPRNDATFRRCRDLFDQGEVVAIFPEGMSRVDRGLLPLRYGAAHLMRSYIAGASAPNALIVPVGLYYSDRRRFRSDVTIVIGPPMQVDADPVAGTDGARILTERVTEALRAQVVTFADPRDARICAVLEAIASGGGPFGYEQATRLARSLEIEREFHPENYRRIEAAARRVDRIVRALGIEPSALRPRNPGKRALAWTLAMAGALPALAGFVIHVIPASIVSLGTRPYAGDPTRVAFARITAGAVLVPTTYAILMLALAARHAPTAVILGAPILFVGLGLHALSYGRRTQQVWERMRFRCVANRRPGLGRRALAAGLVLRRAACGDLR